MTQPDGTLVVGLQGRQLSLLGEAGRREWACSLTLEGMPAGSERLYRLTSRSMRMVNRQGLLKQRMASMGGVAVVEAGAARQIHVRMHVTARMQQFSMLSGWTPDLFRAPVVVLVGEFTARPNPTAVQRIRDLTQQDQFGPELQPVISLMTPLTPRTRPADAPAADEPAAQDTPSPATTSPSPATSP